MDNFPSDGYFDDLGLPVSPTTSSFDALETPAPNQPSLTWSSDEIPILLYDDRYIDETSLNISTTGDNREISVTLSGDRMSYGSMSTFRGSQASVVDHSCLSTLEGSSSICSVGTFGPKREKPTRLDETRLSRHRSVLPGSPPPTAVLLPPNSVSSMGSDGRSGTTVKESVSRQRGSSTRTLPSVFTNPTALTTKQDSIPLPSPHDSALFSTSLDNFDMPYENNLSVDNHDDSVTCLTPNKTRLLRTISWISTHNWDYQHFKEYIAQENLSRTFPIHVSDDYLGRTHPPQPVTPPRRRIPDPHNTVSKPRPLPIAYQIVGQEETLFPSPNPIRQTTDLDWLKDITVQFLVDQEGFRAAHPNFRFISIARLRSSQHSRFSNTIMAQFRPTIRQAFHFHDAPFESPPVLRRVSVNDDETYDYVSKQAYLTMKANGVYVLHGHEISTTIHNPEASKLFWQFEYLVDDRLIDGTGRVMDGEKILTPLTFSCVPSLIHPSQGRRNNVIHVVKKGVALKLVSEKLQPPGTVRTMTSQTDAHIPHFFSSKAHTWNFHRRGQSHGVQQAELLKRRDVLQGLPPSPTSELQRPEHRFPRRRRASSADENSNATINARGTSGHHDSVYSASGARPSISFPRHIIPRAKLTELLGSPVQGLTRMTSIGNSNRNTEGFVPLTPSTQRIHMKVIEPARTR